MQTPQQTHAWQRVEDRSAEQRDVLKYDLTPSLHHTAANQSSTHGMRMRPPRGLAWNCRFKLVRDNTSTEEQQTNIVVKHTSKNACKTLVVMLGSKLHKCDACQTVIGSLRGAAGCHSPG